MLGKKISRRKAIGLAIIAAGLIAYIFCLPQTLFEVPYSTIIEDKQGNLLSASIAADGQWRFPRERVVPEKFEKALVLFEDKRFFYHPGVDPLSTSRALWQNVSAGKIVSGGSTLTMQVVRLSRQNRARTFFEKAVEMVLATRLEWRHSKQEILSIYAAHAPFGGNVVGLSAACWRYFGRQPEEMSWGEAALLAVLPNNPSLINLSKNRTTLKNKRDRLLRRLAAENLFDDVTLQLALAEELPEDPRPMPRLAPHLLTQVIREGGEGKRIESTLDGPLQKRAADILNDHAARLKGNQIFNLAALIIKVETSEVMAYIGNVPAGSERQEQVDVIRAPRSTGSILKPFLYAALQDEGKLLPRSLVADIPTIIDGFSPQNFSRQYDGAVAADQALIRSLNIPAVHELRTYRYEKFYSVMKDIGISTLNRPADHYGLSMILGGAEGTLWDITGVYASMARTLNNYFKSPGSARYNRKDFHAPVYIQTERDSTQLESTSYLSAASIWLTFEAMKELYRPGEESGWRHFQSAKKIAWKTGTSFGYRDGWAVGVNPEYAVGVWVGNADGEGRPGLTGTDAAAPVLFDLFSQLPGNSWFQMPRSEMAEVKVCTRSGWRASEFCDETTDEWISKKGLDAIACNYHKKVHLSRDEKFRVHSECERTYSMTEKTWFVLPPVQEYYYKSHHASYKALPPYRADCYNPSSIAAMDLIYPKWNSKIFVPRGIDGTPGQAIFQVVHRDPSAAVYWHIDGKFVGSTQNSHKLPFSLADGEHQLTLVDAAGETLERRFSVISSN
ncbi:MAG: penicillin-binding protein 1C [Bacteroidota bacterium]